MTAPTLQWLARLFAERMLNTAAEGMILAGMVWALLRCVGRQSSGTRFAVWFVALLAMVALPLFGGAGGGAAHIPAIASATAHREIILSASWAGYLFAAWAMGAALLLLRLSVGLWQVHRLRSDCREVELQSLEPAIAEILREFATRNQATLCVSERLNVPAALGFFRPAIVFPAWLLPQLSADEIQVILLHEHAHLRRRDPWTNLAQKFVKAVFFFHPAVWWIESHLTLEREMACDDIVLAQSASPKAYASFLVSFAEKLQNAHTLELVQALVSRMRQMSLRVAQILDARRSRSTGLWAPVVAINMGLAALVMGAAPYVPQWVVFRNPPSQTQPARIQTSRIDAASGEAQPAVARSATVVSRPMAQPVSLRLDSSPQPAVILAVYHPRAAALPQRLKSTLKSTLKANQAGKTAVTPDVLRAMAEAQEQPNQETFVVVQTTQYDSSGAGVWTLCIWRVKGGEKQLESAFARII
jgi:beta-lactamase regulating signal transducer with metallopeptidase domain